MLNDQPTNLELVFHKIHFTVVKKIKFGQAVYVCGQIRELGVWKIKEAFRLKWNQGDKWTGTILISEKLPQFIEFKYVIANWNNPSEGSVEWEVGAHNRRIDYLENKRITVCDDRFNMDRTTLHMKVKKEKKYGEESFYVVGDIKELGCWKDKKIMKRSRSSSRSRSFNDGLKENSHKASNKTSKIQNEDYQNYSYSFYLFRGRQKFHYYYIKKSQVYQSERRPGRVFQLSKQHNNHPFRDAVVHLKGDISIYDECNIDELVFSNITKSIFVGSYLRSPQDFAKLRDHKITAILSIQSERDFNSHGLSQHYIQLLCEEYGLTYKSYSIEDMNAQDFIQKASGALKMMSNLMKAGGKIYVHCSAGIYRSPQIIAMYLAMFEGFSLESAVEIIKQKHPYAKPNLDVIQEAMGVIDMKKKKRVF